MPVVVHLDLQPGQAGVAVELTVVTVRLAVAAAHRPLMGLTALRAREGERDVERRERERESKRERARERERE